MTSFNAVFFVELNKTIRLFYSIKSLSYFKPFFSNSIFMEVRDTSIISEFYFILRILLYKSTHIKKKNYFVKKYFQRKNPKKKIFLTNADLYFKMRSIKFL